MMMERDSVFERFKILANQGYPFVRKIPLSHNLNIIKIESGSSEWKFFSTDSKLLHLVYYYTYLGVHWLNDGDNCLISYDIENNLSDDLLRPLFRDEEKASHKEEGNFTKKEREKQRLQSIIKKMKMGEEVRELVNKTKRRR